MKEEEEHEPQDYKPLTDLTLIKILAILFALGIYGIIFLKIVFLK